MLDAQRFRYNRQITPNTRLLCMCVRNDHDDPPRGEHSFALICNQTHTNDRLSVQRFVMSRVESTCSHGLEAGMVFNQAVDWR